MKRANIIIIILYGILLIGLVYFYFFYMPQFDDEPPILNFYNQENLGFNLRDLFIISLISPIVGFFVFGILLSYIFCYIIERKFIRKVFKKKQNDKKAVKEIEYIEANKTENIFKEALFASVFAFNISYQILKIPNLVNIFVNNEYYLGEVNPLIYSYFAILPIMMMVSSALYSAIWLLKRTNLYISIKNDGYLTDRHNISSFFENLLKNYTTISTFFMIFLITWDYYIDLTNVSIDVPLMGIFLFPAFVFVVAPIYFFPLAFIVKEVNPLAKKKRKEYKKKEF